MPPPSSPLLPILPDLPRSESRGVGPWVLPAAPAPGVRLLPPPRGAPGPLWLRPPPPTRGGAREREGKDPVVGGLAPEPRGRAWRRRWGRARERAPPRPGGPARTRRPGRPSWAEGPGPGPGRRGLGLVPGRRERGRCLAAKTGRGPPGCKESAARGGGAGPAATRASAAPAKKAARIRPARSAAITLTVDGGDYPGVLAEARAKIPLAPLGIGDLRIRRAITGARVLEARGPEGSARADALAEKLREAFAGREDIRVSRPVKTVEMRVTGLEDSVTQAEVAAAVAAAGGCGTGEVKVGPVRAAPAGMGAAWVRCPAAAAKKAGAAGRLRIGWAMAGVALLAVRPLQCYKCMGVGHVRRTCCSGADRTDCCYRCGERGHLASSCVAPVMCPACQEAGRRAGHKIGSVPECAAQEEGEEEKGWWGE